jgi:hypothetical protein
VADADADVAGLRWQPWDERIVASLAHRRHTAAEMHQFWGTAFLEVRERLDQCVSKIERAD